MSGYVKRVVSGDKIDRPEFAVVSDSKIWEEIDGTLLIK
jgi:hypothetical protein